MLKLHKTHQTKHHFQEIQLAFCQHIRQATTIDSDPQSKPQLQVSHEALSTYRELLFNNVCNFINIAFPISQKLLGEDIWLSLLNEFFAQSRCQSPFYNDISLQFREYLSEKQHPILAQYPWLEELLQYEWLELYLDTVELPSVATTTQNNWQLNTTVWVLAYQYPVYQWTTEQNLADIQQHYSQPTPSIIMVWRDKDDDICVQILSAMQAVLIEHLNQSPHETEQLITIAQQYFPQFGQQHLIDEILELQSFLTACNLLIHNDHNII